MLCLNKTGDGRRAIPFCDMKQQDPPAAAVGHLTAEVLVLAQMSGSCC